MNRQSTKRPRLDRRFLEHLETPRLFGALSGISAVSLLADGLSPLLLPYAPLLLVAMSPRSMYVLAVAHRIPLLVLVPLITLRLCLTDPVHFELGRRVPVGPTSHGVVGRVGRQLRRFVDAVPGFGFILAVAAWPVSHTLLLAGAGGAKRRSVAIADVLGTAVRVLVMCLVLSQIERVVGAAHMASHIGPLALLNVATYATIGVIAKRRRNKASDAWDDIATQVESLRLEDRVREVYALSWPESAPRASTPQPSVPHRQPVPPSSSAGA